MATLLAADGMSPASRAGGHVGSSLELNSLLGVILALCAARRVDVLMVEDGGRASVSIASMSVDGPRDEADAGTPALDGAAMLQGEPRHLSSASAGAERVLTFRLAERGSRRFYLLLELPDPGAGLAAGAAGLLPALTRTLAQMLDLETRLMAGERECAAALASIDQSRCCVIAVTAEGRPVMVNQPAAICLEQERTLQIRRGLVRPVHYADAVRFQAALDSVAQPGRGKGDASPAVVMLLKQTGTARPPVLAIAPIGAKVERPVHEDEAVAVIRMVQPVQEGERGLDTMCQLLGMSRVEARLVAQLHRGQTLTEAAAEMRIKVDTARSYLKQIFNKTDTHRQADLLSLLSHYLRVMRGHSAFRPL